MSETPRFELRHGKYGPYFHDRRRGGGYDLPLEEVLAKLNRLEGYKERLRKANEKLPESEKF